MTLTYESRLLIDGKLCEASGDATYDNINPATEAVIGPVADANEADMERAITAARRAFDETSWSTDKAFRNARLFDEEYDFWQNAEDPLQYEVRGRSYKGLPMRPNGLPPPVEQLVIDTSRNPGRRVLRDGFIEAVGCPMWLGEGFWSITGANREAICAERWLRCETRPGNVVRLRPALALLTVVASAMSCTMRARVFSRSIKFRNHSRRSCSTFSSTPLSTSAAPV
jgi:hypothetical protein